ncbi:hypothetical protein Sme01_03920 [Sphaerisporangium melleum]|uniref:Uncharacterized protein n=1 Tax=Sphaerisporangium melleum TaxID=321316 RepID=A0A917QPE4_9ACTN|nr:hypothetical protein [Sphaerisporangium melleum]GGK62008.1 hypothetical protein GCM10007964_01470 [Sphaerisporangium melleum]GII67916.1 hypothetical protein Sme01_03920 [Sphaerisporangium melleum]
MGNLLFAVLDADAQSAAVSRAWVLVFAVALTVALAAGVSLHLRHKRRAEQARAAARRHLAAGYRAIPAAEAEEFERITARLREGDDQ